MSDLQRSFARAQLSRLPFEAPIFDEREEDEENEEDSHMHSASDSSTSSTGTIVPSPTKHLFARPKTSKPSTPLSPLEWSDFFDTEFSLPRQTATSNLIHHVYFSPPLASGPLFVTHHGAGSSGLSFACFAKEVKALVPKAGILSLDARGHGKTTISAISPTPLDPLDPGPPTSDLDLDLSLDTLASDLTFVLHAVQKRMSWTQLPDLVLVGHSLGGAVVVHLANQEILRSSILGYAVLDVVEGSAMEALAHMETYLANRPGSFPSVEKAIDWHIRSRTIRNPLSARISVPALLKPSSSSSPSTITTTTLPPSASPTPNPPSKLIFHPPLLATSPLWPTWFQSLSSKFLRPPAAKLLILAGTDRLDKELTIGQMQGKYQLCVVPQAGHFVHEDEPAKVAEVVVGFWRRNERGAVGGLLGGLKKVGGP